MFAANPKLLRFRLAEVIADALTRTLEEHPNPLSSPGRHLPYRGQDDAPQMNRRSQKARTMLTTLCAAVSLFVSSCTTAKHSDEWPLVHEVPLQKLSATMSLAQLDKLMHENFVIVTDVRKLPESVKGSFCNVEKCNFVGVKFDMVNPGEVMSTDYIIPGVPNKQPGFAALNGDSAIVFYKRGGYADQLCVTAFDFRQHTSWGASLKVFRVNTLEQLRTAISDGQFIQGSPGDRR
jgi:hypothetical protein